MKMEPLSNSPSAMDSSGPYAGCLSSSPPTSKPLFFSLFNSFPNMWPNKEYKFSNNQQSRASVEWFMSTKMTFNKRNWRILFRISLTESNITLKVYLWVSNCVLVISSVDMSNLTFLFLPTWSISILDDKFVVFLRFVWAHSVEYLFLVSLSSRYFT